MSILIAKPKMSDKLLSRPPFRFLYDVLMALNARNGMFDALLSAAEKDSATLTEKRK